MSNVKLERARTRFRKALSIAPQDRFLQMLWAIDALRAGRMAEAARLIRFSPEQAKQAYGDEHAIFPWELETLAAQSFTVRRLQAGRFYLCEDFGTASMFANMLRALENEEYGVRSQQIHIFNEMHRTGQRQFGWQRGGPNLPDFYRPLYLYGQGQCATYFADTHELSINEFSLLGFSLFAMFSSRPYAVRPPNLAEMGLGRDTIEAGLKLLSIPIDKAGPAQRDLLVKTGAATWSIAYQPSVLRRFPVLTLGGRPERLIAPLPILVLQRVTSELYYDLLAPGGNLRNEIADRFEQYCADYITAMAPAFRVEREYLYAGKRKGSDFKSPDVLVEQGGTLAIVIECKATKLTVSAKFSYNPAIDAEARYGEIGRGVFQLWRFFAHTRMGLTGRTLTDATAGVVLTLDTWLVMARVLEEHVLKVANALADADGDIIDADRRPVSFATIQDFERLFSQADEAGVLAAIAASHEERFQGWLLPNIERELNGPPKARRRYPFKPDAILPWWTQFESGEDEDGESAL